MIRNHKIAGIKSYPDNKRIVPGKDGTRAKHNANYILIEDKYEISIDL